MPRHEGWDAEAHQLLYELALIELHESGWTRWPGLQVGMGGLHTQPWCQP